MDIIVGLFLWSFNLFVFYYIIKNAVANGVKEALKERDEEKHL